MKSAGTLRHTIKGWSVLSFSVSPVLPLSSPSFSLVYPLCVCAYVCVRVRESVVSDDSEAVASCRHCRWQIWTKKGREERNRLQTAWAILTERLSGLSEQIGKVTNCDSVVMSHSLNYTLLYLTFHFHFNELVFKKNVMPFYSCKGCTRGSHKLLRLSCLSQLLCIYAAGL